jgi:hypothetical protein
MRPERRSIYGNHHDIIPEQHQQLREMLLEEECGCKQADGSGGLLW